jgi:uracil-DNA glycosylase family 4
MVSQKLKQTKLMLKVKDCRACDGCPLQRLFPENNLVPPQLGPSLRLVVAEAPGEQESIEGKPLVGGSGKIFDNLLRKAGINRAMLSVINTVNCRPPNNIYPTDSAARKYCTEQEGTDSVSHCYRAHVKPLLLSRPWERVDIIGGKALNLLTGLSGIERWRGSPVEVDTDEIDKRLKS